MFGPQWIVLWRCFRLSSRLQRRFSLCKSVLERLWTLLKRVPKQLITNNRLDPLRDADLPYRFRRSLKTFLFGQWGHGAVRTVLTAPSRNNLIYFTSSWLLWCLFDVRDVTQLLLLLRVLYDNLPSYLVFLPVTESRLGRCLDQVTRSMSRELMLTRQRQKTRRSDDDEPATDNLSVAQLQADTDNHVMSLLHSFYWQN